MFTPYSESDGTLGKRCWRGLTCGLAQDHALAHERARKNAKAGWAGSGGREARRPGWVSPDGQGGAAMAPVIPFSADRYRLRLTLEGPLPMLGESRSPRPFDHYLAELVRDEDARVVAVLDVYFLRNDAVGVSYVRAAAALGSEYLVRVCLDALDVDGHVQGYIEHAFADAMTDVFVLDAMQILDPDADRPVLRGMFVRELSSALSRGFDVFFINAADVELSFWRDTLGARRVGDFIVASGARPLPVYPRPVQARPTRQTQLRVLGRPKEPN